MPCNQLSDAVCASAISGDNLTPDNAAAVSSLINSSNLTSWFNQYQSNLFGFNGNADAESGVSFNLSPFLLALCKAYELTGDQSYVTEMENRIDDLFSKNDEAIVANNVQVPNANGQNGSILPYQSCAVPAGFDLNTAHCGWSRWAPNWLSGTCPAARARPELLTDGLVCTAILSAIKCMKDCGSLNQTKANVWLADVKKIIDVWDVEWKESHVPTNQNMGPDCNGYQSYTVTGQYVDQFDKTYPLNQQAIMLEADLLFQQCSNARTGAKARAAKFIQDINSQYFVSSSGTDEGWLYTLFCNCTERWDDIGHAVITLGFLKSAAGCGATGAAATLQRAMASLKVNAFIGSGASSDLWWYNNGNSAHGSLGSNVASGPWGGQTVGSCSTIQNYSSGSGGSPQVFRGVQLFSDLPEPLNTNCQVQRMGLMQNWTSTGNASTGDELLAVLCYMQSLCDVEVVAADPTCTNTTQTITPGTTIPAAFLATGGTPGYTLSNFTSTTTSLTMISGGSGIVASTDLTPGTYTVSYTITDQAGNSTTCQHAVVYQASDMACQVTVRDVDPISTIQSDSLVSGGTGPFTISNFQSGSSAITSTDSAISIGNIDPGSYDLSYTITDSSNTSVNCSLRVTYVDQCSVGCSVGVTVSGDENQICIGSDPVSLCVGVDTSTGNQINNEPGYSYKTCNSECCGVGLDSAILWCNLCLRNDVTVTSTGVIEGSDRFVCECEDGLFLEFEDELTYTLTSTSGQGADSFVIWGHDLCSGAEIQLFHDGVEVDLQSHDGTTAVLSEGCSHCGTDNGCKAVAMFFECTTATTRQVVITAPGRHRINRMGWMQSWAVELEEGHASEHNASQYEIDYKTNLCGEVIGGTRKPRTNTTEITLTDVSSQMLKHEWRPVRDYLESLYPIYWIEDRNCPSDLSMGHLNPVENTVYSSPCEQTITIPLSVRTFAGVK